MGGAGTFDQPIRLAGELSPHQVALIDLLLNDIGLCEVLVVTGQVAAGVAAVRLRGLAKLVVTVMPAVVEDLVGRFGVLLNDDDAVPSLYGYERAVTLAAQALRGYLHDHDRGEWVDPYAMAGAVADLHDALRDLVVVHDLTPVLAGGAA
jgi:hypothetical protein